MIRKYFLAWFGIVILAIINGTIRELTYKPFVGDLAAHQISTVTLLILFAVYVWAIGEKWKIESAKEAWTIGLVWLVIRWFLNSSSDTLSMENLGRRCSATMIFSRGVYGCSFWLPHSSDRIVRIN